MLHLQIRKGRVVMPIFLVDRIISIISEPSCPIFTGPAIGEKHLCDQINLTPPAVELKLLDHLPPLGVFVELGQKVGFLAPWPWQEESGFCVGRSEENLKCGINRSRLGSSN
jgi:hypothetical protein